LRIWRRCVNRGTGYFLIPATAFKWLSGCAHFKQHLDTHYRTIWSNNFCIIYHLSERSRALCRLRNAFESLERYPEPKGAGVIIQLGKVSMSSPRLVCRQAAVCEVNLAFRTIALLPELERVSAYSFPDSSEFESSRGIGRSHAA
jgi:hypothetical protein